MDIVKTMSLRCFPKPITLLLPQLDFSIKLLFLFFAYFYTAKLGLSLAAMGGFATLIWPPSGIALAVIFLYGYSFWPAIAMAAFLANYTSGAPLIAALCIAVGNTLEPLIGAFLLRAVKLNPALNTLKDIFALIIFGCLICTLVSATIGVNSLWLSLTPVTPLRFRTTWFTWWLGDILSNLIISPVLLTWLHQIPARLNRKKFVEALSLFFATILFSLLIFSGESMHAPGVFLLPLIIWTAFRFGARAVASIVVVISAIAIWNTVLGKGPFLQPHLYDRLFHLQLFIAVHTLTGLILAAIIAERTTHDAKLAESEAIKSAILASSLDCIITVDEHGRILEFNPAAEKNFKFTKSEILGEPIVTTLISPKLREKYSSEVERYLATGKGHVINNRMEMTGIRKDGTEFPIELAIMKIPVPGHKLFSCTIRDITERKQFERELTTSKERLDTILKNVPEGITLQDKTGAFIYANKAAVSMVNLNTIDEFLHTSPESIRAAFDIFDEDNKPYPVDQLPSTLAIQTKQPQEALLKVVHKPFGQPRWRLAKAVPIFNHTDEMQMCIGIWQDITELKLSEDRLQFLAEASNTLASSLDFRTTLTSIGNLAISKFADWCAIEIVHEDKMQNLIVATENSQLKKIALNLRNHHISNSNSSFLVKRILESGKAELLNNISEEILSTNIQDSEELAFLRSLNLSSVLIVPIRLHDNILGLIVFALAGSNKYYGKADLELAKELARRAAIAIDNATLYKEAQDAIRSRDEFLSIASHELNTPLTSLSLHLQLLNRNINKIFEYLPPKPVTKETFSLTPKKVSEMLNSSLKQSDRLASLVNELLDLTRIRLGKMDLKKEWVDLTKLTQDVILALQTESSRMGSPIIFRPSGSVQGNWDPSRIEQVISNLISNAIKYGNHRPIEINLAATEKVAKFSIQDHGIGIAEELQPKIFERFERAVSSQNISGLGLGLYISRQIIDAHHGDIQVSSHLGRGSTFTVELPISAC